MNSLDSQNVMVDFPSFASTVALANCQREHRNFYIFMLFFLGEKILFSQKNLIFLFDFFFYKAGFTFFYVI